MKIERAIEMLNPEHREEYKSMDEINEACRLGMEALKLLDNNIAIVNTEAVVRRLEAEEW